MNAMIDSKRGAPGAVHSRLDNLEDLNALGYPLP